MTETKTQIQNIVTTVSELTQQFSEIKESLPNNPNAQVNAISLRSGKKVDLKVPPVEPINKPIEQMEENEEKEQEPIQQETAPPKQVPPLREYKARIPYPERLKKDKMDAQYGKFLELFKQLHINLPFVDAIAQMPKYAKFLKDLLSSKRKLEDISSVTMNEECSAALQNQLPEKMTDPGSFTIPCLIGDLSVSNALADLGASINLMPYSIYAKLNLGELKPTKMSIQLADRTVKYPKGIVENLLVRVGKFIFPVDFVILDMKEDDKVPLILGRPFLATARAMVDVCNKKLTLKVGDEEITFSVKKAMKFPDTDTDSLYCIETFSPFDFYQEEFDDNPTIRNCAFGYEEMEKKKKEVSTFHIKYK